jgi:hypothetical protein
MDDDVAEDGAAFLVMELLDGAPAETHWERHGHRMPLKATPASYGATSSKVPVATSTPGWRLSSRHRRQSVCVASVSLVLAPDGGP